LGVHAGIRAAAGGDTNKRIRHLRQRILQRVLHAGGMGLALPAMIIRAVILDTRCQPHQLCSSTQLSAKPASIAVTLSCAGMTSVLPTFMSLILPANADGLPR